MSTTPVPVKLYSVALNRNVAPVAWEGFAGNPISITGNLPARQDFAGVVSITAELHAVQSNSETPLAVSDALEALPTGGSVTLSFSSAAMNRAAGKYFISIYATYPDSRLEVFRVAEIHLVEGASSQLTPPAPPEALAFYVTSAALSATLSGYVTAGALSSALSGYAQTSALSNYVTSGALSTALSSYVTNGTLSSALSSYATTASLSNYVTTVSLNSALASYATTASLSAYVTSAALSTALGSYATTAAVAAGYQPLDTDLTAIAALATTAFGRSLLTAADAAALRTSAGLGGLAVLSAAPAGTLTGTALTATITSAPGLLSAAGGTFASGAFAAAFNPAAPGDIGGATPAAMTAAALSVASGTLVASAPQTLTQTWNNAAVVFTALRVSVTDTASNASSLLLDLQVGGVSRGSITKTGILAVSQVNVPVLLMGTVVVTSNEGTGILALRNSTTAQVFRAYNTYTDSSNYERAVFGWGSSVLRIGTEQLGTGTARDLILVRGSTEMLRLAASGSQFTLPVKFPSYTVGTVPSASSSGAGALIYVSNEAGGAALAQSNGTNWQRLTDLATIS